MIHLHKCKYDKWRAQQTFSYNNIQSDDHKVWNQTEMNKFEEGIEKLGKDFYQIKIQFVIKNQLKQKNFKKFKNFEF